MTQPSPAQGGLIDLLRRRIVAAPMAGGLTTAGLVTAVADAGALGFLAAGYKTPGAMAAEITAVRAATAEPFGVNVFVPGAPCPYSEAIARYLDSLGPSVALGDASWDDDGFDGKIAALLTDPPAVTSFTFGCPAAGVIRALQDAGSVVVITVTSPGEALVAGAVAAQCGTAFLRSPESGAHLLHKAALADPRFTGTTLTRAFSGRPARGLVNKFILDHADAPAAYPEINNATRPLRAAAAASGDTDRMSLWAGQGYRSAAELPAGEIVERLCA